MESKINYSLIIKNIRHIKRSSPEFNNKQARPSDAVMEISKYLTLKHYYPNPNNPFLFHHAYSNSVISVERQIDIIIHMTRRSQD